ncbi:MAG: oligosaccharide flippase family protein [Betaproteobacteria bacterium]|nr:oligosaccharide flippase family protein [Betaproteobacteria bacterium]
MTKSKNPSRFFVNAIANWGAFLFVAIVSFFLSPFIVQHLGATAYGVWSLLVALVGYLGLLDFGVRGAVTRYVAHHYAVDDNEACSSIVTAGLVMFGILGLLAILLSGVFAYFSPTLFNIPETLVLEARIALILGGLTVATTLIGAVFAGVVTGLERFDISSGVEVGVTAIRTIAVVIALNAGYGLVALGYIHLAASVLYGVAAWTTVRRIYPALRLKLRGSLMPHIKTIVSFSAF